MAKSVRLGVVSALLLASISIVSTPVFGADAGSSGAAAVGPAWVPLDPPEDSWHEMARRAKPIDYRPRALPAHTPWSADPEQDVKPFFVPPAEPTGPFQSSATVTSEARVYQAAPVNYTRTEVLDPTQSPFIQHGKLFMDFPSGAAVCSGTIVTSVSEDLVLTAGHCLEDPNTGEASIGAVFVPGYRVGTAPAGGWVAEGYAVTDQWHASLPSGGDPRFDLGILKISPNQDGSGLSLQDRFGSRGAMFNLTYRQRFASFGYPASPGPLPKQNFNGERLYTCSSAVGFQDPQFTSPPKTTGMGCDMTGGSSGGGWVVQGQFVNSVVSYGLNGQPEVQFGPYFGSVAQAFYEEFSGVDHADPGPGGNHGMGLTLNLRKHLIAKGSLAAQDGFASCAANAPVGVFKFVKKTGSFKLLKVTSTTATGTWKVKLRDSAGRYAALSPEIWLDDRNLCLEAASPVRRHRH